MLSNAQIKLVNSLAQKKYRKQHKLFIAEGVKLVNELLLSEIKIHSLFATRPYLDANLKNLPAFVNNKLTLVTEAELRSISQSVTPNEVAGIFQIPDQFLDSLTSPVVILLDAIRDPGNLGTIIRTADWFGISEIVCSEDCVDLFNPKVVQATMGSITRVNVYYENLEKIIRKHRFYHWYYSAMKGKNLHEAEFELPVGIIIGNESNGVSQNIREIVSKPVSIPGSGSAESLNAATATAILVDNILRITR